MTKHTLIRGCNVNLNGLSSKVQSLQKFVDRYDLQLVCVTESHLTHEVLSPFVKIPHFNLIRNDVKGTVHKHGVCTYVHENVLTDNVCFPLSNVLMFRLRSFNIHIILVYRPPSYDATQNEKLAVFLEGVTTGKECIILGDFNLPNIHWSTNEHIPACSVPPMENRFLEGFNSVGLVQWVTEPTYPSSGNTLDLLFTTQSDCMGKVEVVEPLPACDHCPVLFEYLCDSEDLHEVGSQVSKRLLWHKGKYSRMNDELSCINWDFELGELSSSEAYDRFVLLLQDLIKGCVPTATEYASGKKPWKRNPPRSLTRETKAAWNLYKLTRTEHGRKSNPAKEAYAKFAELNRKMRSFQIFSQSQYEQGLIERFKENPKFLHAYIRGEKNCPVLYWPFEELLWPVTY